MPRPIPLERYRNIGIYAHIEGANNTPNHIIRF